MEPTGLFLVQPEANEALDQAIARGMANASQALHHTPTLTNVLQGDPFLAEQLDTLRKSFELRPAPATGLLARIRIRLAWWLCGTEFRRINQNQAAMIRIIDSLVVLVDHERAARRRLEESLSDR
jgi:hypothetical protein